MKTKILQTILISILITTGGFACLFSPAVQGEINPGKENSLTSLITGLIGLTRSSNTTSSGNANTNTTGTSTGTSADNGTTTTNGTSAGNGSTTTGTGTATVSAPSSLVYTGSPFTFTNGATIATQTPTITGTITNCAVTPSLPTGLILNATTCAISGTPTVNQAATSYTITASNSSGNTTGNVSITVNMAAPSNLVYSGSPFTFTNGSAIVTQTPTVTGTVTGCVASPSMPTGLILNATTCAISGTPTVNQGANSYTITASNAGGNTTASVNVTVSSPITPIGTPTTASGSGITQTTQIVITFNRPMNTVSLSLTGLMASESNGGVWSTVTNTNDKLTVTATTSWTVGSSRTLTINCNDTIGTPMTTLNLSYGVLDGNVYVKTTGNDSNPGTQTQPKLTIQAAINLADALYTTANVKVAQGTYNDTITMANGVSIYGGYSSASWGVRLAQTYVSSVISPVSWAVQAASISSLITVDGFSLKGKGSISFDSGVVYIYNSNIILSNNHIYNIGGSTYSQGVYIWTEDGFKARIWNNTIYGITGSSGSIGINIYRTASGLDVWNNTIHSEGSYSRGIFMQLVQGTPNIQNNVIVTTGNGTCIYETDSLSSYIMRTANTIRNNDLYCQTAYYTTNGFCTANGDGDGISTTCTVSEMESLSHILLKGGNISVNPNFINQSSGNYHLSASSPISVTQGGLNLSASFTTDKDGVARTAPWSIGAYEY
jgi:hypothetical protein